MRLAGSKSIVPEDPFWNQLLAFTFQSPSDSAEQRLMEESVSTVCKSFAINNCRTGNFGSLIKVFILRATELKSTSQIEDNLFVWQTYNALFIIRNVCKYFVENLSEEVIIQQFETKMGESEGMMGSDLKGPLAEQLMKCLIEVLVDIPTKPFTYGLHLEALNVLLVMLSIQMFHSTPASSFSIYRYFMQGSCAIHACVLMKTLLQNYIVREKCPPGMLQEPGGGVMAAVTSSLWAVMTLGLGSKSSDPPEGFSDALIADSSLLLILVLANHCTSDKGLPNPYREALFSFTDSEDTENHITPLQTVATFKLNFTQLYSTMCKMLKEDQSTLLLYLLLHRNMAVRSFILSRTDVDQMVIPILTVLYDAPERNSHHIYMALIILLVLSEDDYFNKGIHEMIVKNVTWFKERAISEITLGGLLVLVVIRTIQFNMTRMRDKYLHTNCLAALANMSAEFKNLHPYVTQRLVSLYALLQKKHARLVERIRSSATENHTGESGSEDTEQDDYVQDLAVLEEVLRMVLEIINSCLSHSLQFNPNLVYTLLYQKQLFSYLRTHPTFQDIIQNIDTVLSFFSARVEKADKNISVTEALEVIRQGSMEFKKTRLKKFPELKFKYVEEDEPEDFFIPYVWSLVFHASNLYFNSAHIQLFPLNAANEETASAIEEGLAAAATGRA